MMLQTALAATVILTLSKGRNIGSSEKFVFFVGMGDMSMLNGRYIIA
jgi:hypothetical protein